MQVFRRRRFELYAEADLIGVEDYPDSGLGQGGAMQLVAPSYNKPLQRIPVAIGFNVPTVKTLDILNVEMESFGAQYYNDPSNVISNQSQPLPNDVTYWGTANAPNKSPIKWSVYAKSFFNGHFALTGQIARDHLRLASAAYDYTQEWNELLVTSNDWWWMLKASWMF